MNAVKITNPDSPDYGSTAVILSTQQVQTFYVDTFIHTVQFSDGHTARYASEDVQRV